VGVKLIYDWLYSHKDMGQKFDSEQFASSKTNSTKIVFLLAGNFFFLKRKKPLRNANCEQGVGGLGY